MVITGRAALLATLGCLPALLAPRPDLAVLLGLLLLGVLVTADVMLAASAAGLRIGRSGEPLVRLGEETRSVLTVHNPGGRRARGALRDIWTPAAGATPDRHRLDVPAGGSRVVSTGLHPMRRGDLRGDRVTARTVGPLGLAARQHTHEVPGAVRVLPPFLSRKHLPARLARLRELQGQHPALVRGHGTEFDALREYVVGDDVRSIDWRATARAQDVVVRTWRPERDRRVLLVLDTGRTSAGRVGVAPTPGVPSSWPRLDWSMDAALLLAALASRAGDRVDLLAFDRRLRAWVSGASGGQLLPALVDAMAPLEPQLVESDADALVATVLARAPRRCLVVLLTDLNPAALSPGLLPLLPRLRAHHQVLLAAVSDPRVAALAAARGGSAEVYAAAAAEQHRAQRRHLTEELVRRGVDVVAALPEELAPALADAYLAMKAAGRL